jgi:S-methylmethionine-dependent homocysteine/selenocysteine methylase
VDPAASGFAERLGAGFPTLLDAAMGTRLQQLGADSRLPLWSARALLEAPELVSRIHSDEAAAGADVLTANTFRTHRRTLETAGLGERPAGLTRLAVSLAREAARKSGRTVFVAGSMAPLEDCYRPDLVPEDSALAREHAEQAENLAAAGVDLLLLETHNTVRELAAAARAARRTGLPFVASVVTDGRGKLLSGEPIGAAREVLLDLEPAAVGVNCVPARNLREELSRWRAAGAEGPLVAYGNLGLPSDHSGWAFTEELAPADYGAIAKTWLDAGALLIGGCCGTTPAHTRALRSLLDSRRAQAQPMSIASPKE